MGGGVNRDIKQAVEWYRKAAQEGNSYHGYWNLVCIVHRGLDIKHSISGSEEDILKKFLKTPEGKEMLENCKRAAELGLGIAQKSYDEWKKYI